MTQPLNTLSDELTTLLKAEDFAPKEALKIMGAMQKALEAQFKQDCLKHKATLEEMQLFCSSKENFAPEHQRHLRQVVQQLAALQDKGERQRQRVAKLGLLPATERMAAAPARKKMRSRRSWMPM